MKSPKRKCSFFLWTCTNEQYFLIFCIILAVLFIFILPKNNIFERRIPPLMSTTRISDKLTSNEYADLKKKLKQIVMDNNPTEAIVALQTQININPKVERYCHGLSHEIGHAAFAKYGFVQALDYQDDICGSGFIHGAIEEYFVKINDPKLAIMTACQTGSLSIQLGKCRHGVGHGLMFYTNNNIPLSLQYCDNYSDAIGKIQCSEGVFMENFNSDARFHTSKYLNPKDSFFPCREQTDFYKDSCYFYAPDYYLHLHEGNYKGAIKWCDTAENGFILKCDMGVGSRTMKYNMGSPKIAEQTCMTANSREKTASCIDGMLSYFLVQFNSLSRGNNLCATLEGANQATCYQAVKNRNKLFLN